MNESIRIVHYVNQFFGHIGGEESANVGISVYEKAIGPGAEFEKCFDRPVKVVATIVCGDNYFSENPDTALPEIMDIIRHYQPQVFFAGPAFAAGRYGMACATLCMEVKKQLGIPSVTALNELNPGVDYGRKELFIVKTGQNARTMQKDIKQMVSFAIKLLDGRKFGLPDEEGYFKRGWCRNVRTGVSTPNRAVNMLLAKMKGEPFVSEIELPEKKDVLLASAIAELSKATIVLITDGGLYPAGNPDNMPSSNPDRFGHYKVKCGDKLLPEEWTVRHSGYDNSFILADPNRLVPADAMIQLEKEGYIGKLHEECLCTTGLITTVANSKKIGNGMAEYIRQHCIDGAILTST